MHTKHWIVQGFYLFLLVVKAYNYEFKVTVLDSLVVTLGETVVLPCSFSVGNAWQPEDIVITWQRGLEVVHSFYYSRDQLKRQSSHYASRTRLYHSEMQKGNASLRLENVSVEDVGNYICSVSSQLGSEKKSFPLKVAALYSEPVLQFFARPGRVKLLLTSDGGFPAPTLHWLQGHEDITNITETKLTQDTQSGLYVVSSTLTLRGSSNATLTIILKNEDLMQEIRRNISLLSEYEDESPIANHSWQTREYILFPLMVFTFILLTLVLFHLHKPCRQKICRPDQTKEVIRKTEKCKNQELCCFHVKHETFQTPTMD